MHNYYGQVVSPKEAVDIGSGSPEAEEGQKADCRSRNTGPGDLDSSRQFTPAALE